MGLASTMTSSPLAFSLTWASLPHAASATMPLQIMGSRTARLLASSDGASRAALTAPSLLRMISPLALDLPQALPVLAWTNSLRDQPWNCRFILYFCFCCFHWQTLHARCRLD